MTKVIDLNADQIKNSLEYNLTVGRIIVGQADAEAVPKGQFVFFAAFDGTNNDKDQLDRDPQCTNVGQLWNQYIVAAEKNANLHGQYYAGLGTGGKPFAEKWQPAEVTRAVVKTAEQAYENFSLQASDWLTDHPQGPITVVLTGFSRGVASAVIFSQLLYKNGLARPSGDALRVGVAAGALFDPVATGVKGNQAFPPNVRNLVGFKALNEYRYKFLAVDYSNQTDLVTISGMYGNHCDVGGGYDNGLAAVSLEAATEVLQKSGLPIGDVPYERERLPDESKRPPGSPKRTAEKIAVHSEQDIWSVYNEDGWMYPDKRLYDAKVVVEPASPPTATGRRSFTLYDGTRVIA